MNGSTPREMSSLTEPAVFNIFVYDPRNAQNWDVIENPFSDDMTILGSVTMPVKIAGHSDSLQHARQA